MKQNIDKNIQSNNDFASNQPCYTRNRILKYNTNDLHIYNYIVRDNEVRQYNTKNIIPSKLHFMVINFYQYFQKQTEYFK
jgi:hypothetical protein